MPGLLPYDCFQKSIMGIRFSTEPSGQQSAHHSSPVGAMSGVERLKGLLSSNRVSSALCSSFVLLAFWDAPIVSFYFEMLMFISFVILYSSAVILPVNSWDGTSPAFQSFLAYSLPVQSPPNPRRSLGLLPTAGLQPWPLTKYVVGNCLCDYIILFVSDTTSSCASCL